MKSPDFKNFTISVVKSIHASNVMSSSLQKLLRAAMDAWRSEEAIVLTLLVYSTGLPKPLLVKMACTSAKKSVTAQTCSLPPGWERHLFYKNFTKDVKLGLFFHCCFVFSKA